MLLRSGQLARSLATMSPRTQKFTSVADLVQSSSASSAPSTSYRLRHPTQLFLTQGDITKLHVDAIVNAANERMLGGGGVDGAIHAAAGPELKEACEEVEEVRKGVRCPTGEARVTEGRFGKLQCEWVVHTVGPVYRKTKVDEMQKLLSGAYRSSLQEAAKRDVKSIAFPSISTGSVCNILLPHALSLTLRPPVQSLWLPDPGRYRHRARDGRPLLGRGQEQRRGDHLLRLFRQGQGSLRRDDARNVRRFCECTELMRRYA